MPSPRYVIDANTVISAALTPSGHPKRAIAAARANGIIVLSMPVYTEIEGVLARPKFARAIADDRRREILELLSAAALWFEPPTRVTDCRDPKDNRYLELALAADAKVIVSGDDDLLALDPWRAVRILRPAVFVAQFEVA